MRTCRLLFALLAATLLLAACGGGNPSTDNNPVRLKALISVPNVTPTTNFSFDISGVDGANGRYYFTDRNNAAVDVIDINTNSFVKFIQGGFAGCNTGPSCNGANNDKSGPDGLNLVPPHFLYVGDVNSVKIIDTTVDAVVNTINIGGASGLRADEGCFDPDDNIFMINSPAESPPFATFIDTTTQKIIATLLFTDPGTGPAGPASAGLEACVYDHATNSFINNNDGSTANPHGEADVIPASFIKQGTPAKPVILTLPVPTGPAGNGFSVFPEGNCDPTGLALGPGTDMIVGCRPGTTNAPLIVLIMNRVTGTILATINAGGGDQVWYDPGTNRYYNAASRWTNNGLAGVGGACTAAVPCTPVVAVIDAKQRRLITQTPTGNNAHSVAVDPVTGQMYLPYSSAAAPGGCATCATTFPNGGVLVFTTQ